jgi:hypothetical protein
MVFGASTLGQGNHKVLTYVEYRAVSGVFQILTPTPSPPSVCVLPRTKGGGGTLGYTLAGRIRGGEGVGGSIFWKTPDIGLAS